MCVVMTIARLGLKVKVIGQSQKSMFSAYGRGNALTRSVWPQSSIEDSFSSGNKWSKNFYERPHRRGRIILRATMFLLTSAAAVPLSCRYWKLNDPCCCVHRSRDSHYSSVGWTTPKLPLSVWVSTPSCAWFLGLMRASYPPNSISIGSVFTAQLILETNTQTYRQTTLHATFVAIGRIYALRACDAA